MVRRNLKPRNSLVVYSGTRKAIKVLIIVTANIIENSNLQSPLQSFFGDSEKIHLILEQSKSTKLRPEIIL